MRSVLGYVSRVSNVPDKRSSAPDLSNRMNREKVNSLCQLLTRMQPYQEQEQGDYRAQ